jgi:1-deoxy-D-xylulose-5-phosphate synthase
LQLCNVKSPEDIRNLSVDELESLAREIRSEIVRVVSTNGGHLASSLGTVEITLALHKVFDTPRDKIVWDVGHQSYGHKLITGRYHTFGTLRKLGGISGFPKRAESPYDVYDTGHASGSISYALGLAKARDLDGGDWNVIDVIGDGALTSGVAYEGLNNAGELGTRLIVVLNDNSMSISKNVGGITRYLTLLRLAPSYRSAKSALEKVLDRMPNVGQWTINWLRRLKGGVKYFLFPEAWFESLGFRYYGPIDGHNIEGLIKVFEEVKTINEPVLVHAVTVKGKGYKFAEENPEKFHGVGPFDPDSGEPVSENSGPPSYSKVFGQAMTSFAKQNKELVGITAAMADGTGLDEFAQEFPDRVFDVGIAESHAVAFAAGLAQSGKLPVVAIYSTFLQRAYDQIIEDVCLQKLKVVFAVDRAGLVGEDGETHHGQFDVSYFRTAPGLTIMAPKDESELVNMLWSALNLSGPSAIRYPRGSGEGVSYKEFLDNPQMLEIGKAEVISRGEDANIVAVGSMVYPAIEAAKVLKERNISCGVVNARFVVPLDGNTIGELANAGPLLVVEENVSAGGFGEAVLDAVGSSGRCNVSRLTLPMRYIEHGPQKDLRKLYCMDVSGIVDRVEEIIR